MPVYKNLKAIRKLTNSSLTSIIDITNLNFGSLSSGTLEFLNNIKYDEVTNSFQAYKGTFDFVDITDTLSLKLDGVPTFTIDSLGRAEGQELLVKVAETKRLRFTDFNDWPTIGVPGEVIYTGIQNQRPEFGEDFIGYLQSRGWVSLTDKSNSSYITLIELAGSPPIPGCPTPNTGIIWVGPPGYATETVPTTQTLYYTDENCKVFDLTAGGTGGGGGTGCSFVILKNFTANVPEAIPHNLGSTSVQVQLIDTVTNELITGYVNSYQANSVNITLSQNKNLVKVIVLSADCSGGGGGGGCKGNKKLVSAGDTLTVCADYQYFLYGNFTVEGTVDNYGQVVIANGVLDLQPTGQFNNLGSGSVTILNLATGDSFRSIAKTFSVTSGNPATINHNLGTKNLTFAVRDGNSYVGDQDYSFNFVNDNTITITPSINITAGVITFNSKI